MKNSNFEDVFRKSSISDRGFPFEETSWTDLEIKLDKDKKKKRYLGLWMLFGVGFLSAAISIAIWKWDTSTIESVSCEQETFAKKNVSSSTTINNDLDQEKNNLSLIEEVFPTKEVSIIDQVEQKVESISSGTLITINDSTEISEKARLSESTYFEFNEQSRPIHSLKSIKILDEEIKKEDVILQNPSQIQEVHEDTTIRKEVVELLPLERTKIDEFSIPEDKAQKSASPFISGMPILSKNASTKKEVLINSKGLGFKMNKTTKVSNRSWEVGLTLSYIRQEYKPNIIILTDTVSANIQPSLPVEIVENNSMRTLYYNRIIVGDEVFTRTQPIIRLSFGKPISKWILLRGGLIYTKNKTFFRNKQNLINNNDFDYALSSESSATSTILDLGIHLQPNHKRLKPFLGFAALFSIHNRTTFSSQVYNAQKEFVQSISSFNESNWRFIPFALNIEGGIKYEIKPKLEVGLELFTGAVPSLNGRPFFTSPRLAMQFNYKFR